MTTTTAETLSDLVVAALKAANVAGGNVYGIRAWPTQPDQTPIVRMELPQENKTSWGRNDAQQFTVVATLPMIVQVKSLAQVDEAGAAAARSELADLTRAIEVAVIGNPSLYLAGVQQFPFVRSQARVNADGREIFGQRIIELGLEFYQGPEDFFQAPSDALNEVQVSTKLPDPVRPDGLLDGPKLDITLPS